MIHICFEDNCINEIAKNYQLSGANITSIVSELLIQSVEQELTVISKAMIESVISKELMKKDARFIACPDNSTGPLLIEQRLGRSAVHNGRRM